jgi:phosphohistidine swiveling domain-containing protein
MNDGTLAFLGSERASDAAAAGEKAAALSRLAARGLPVPAGFVVPWASLTPTGSLTEPAHAALRHALASLGGAVAVRSSGLAEDQAGASFAGAYESVLAVSGEGSVLDAIARCVQSASAERVATYRERMGVDAAPISVLVQKMVYAHAAGVAFTAHPVTGERDVVVVSAVIGLGERLVGGLEDAEEWEVRDRPVRQRGVDSILTDAEVAQIAALAREVARGTPTDLEWALTRDDQGRPTLSVLQARPMTALPEPVTWKLEGSRSYVRNFRIGEWIGAPVTPLFESWILTDLERGLHDHFDALTGVRAPTPLHVVVHGWYFYGGMNLEIGWRDWLRILPRTLLTLFGPRRAELLATTPPLAHLGFDAELQRWRATLAPSLRAVVARASVDVETADPAGLVDLVDQIVAATTEQLTSIVGVAGYAAKAEGALMTFWKQHLAELDGSALDVVVGATVAPAAHDVEGLDPVFPTLGERGPVPEPPSAERIAEVLARRDAAEARARAALPARRRAGFDRLVKEARRAHAARVEQTSVTTLGWPTLRRALTRLGGQLVGDGRLAAVDDVFFLERAELLAALAGAPIEADVVARRRLWGQRRRLSPPLVLGTPTGLWKSILTEIQAILHHPEHEQPDALVGMPGSPGRLTGLARVVRSIEELDRLQAGEILVCPVTTPAWTLAFGRASAVVTDTGSVASHASIVAREHGIPAVVGTGTGTSRILDGQRITVDGGRGVVRLAP